MPSVTLSLLLVALLNSVAGSPLQFDAIYVGNECGMSIIGWAGGTPPYSLTIYDARSNAPTEAIGPMSDFSYFWNTDISAGTTIFFTIADSAGGFQQSSSFQIQSSLGANCVLKPGSSTAASADPTSFAFSSVPSSGADATSSKFSPPSSATSSSGTPTISNGTSSFPIYAIVLIAVFVLLAVALLVWRCKPWIIFNTIINQDNSKTAGDITTGAGGRGGSAEGINNYGGAGGRGGSVGL